MQPLVVPDLLAEMIQPGHFFVGNGITLDWHHGAKEEVPWEIYQGRLLDSSQTRATKTFETWSVYWSDDTGRSVEPILSLRLDPASQQLHVVRAIYCSAWEGFDAGDNVFLSREVRKWVRELVGTIELNDFRDVHALRREVVSLLFQAVVGNRLPITSLEAPLPAFSLGKLAYFYRPIPAGSPDLASPLCSVPDLIQSALHPGLSWLEKAKLLETVLRSSVDEEVTQAANLFAAGWCLIGHQMQQLVALCRTLINETALTPWTHFVDRFLAFLQALVSAGQLSAEQHADLLGYFLRQNARHLTAYDLVTFHHRGANYPDALLLDAVLKAYFRLIDDRPELFVPTATDNVQTAKTKRIRRRALRQGWLLRCLLEGIPVPAEPTSPGENARILPPPHTRIPEEQILEPAKRSKRLFAEHPLPHTEGQVAAVLRDSILDLQYSEELVELGTAVFLDRPLGVHKQPGEPDRTMLFSFEAFSKSIAKQRLQYLDRTRALLADARRVQTSMDSLRSLPVEGLPLRPAPRTPRPGAVSLQDATRVADDFVVLRSTRQTVSDFLARFDFSALTSHHTVDFLNADRRLLIIDAASAYQGSEAVLVFYDASLRRRLELQIDGSLGYRSRRGQECPAGGLRVIRLWDSSADGTEMKEHDLRRENIRVLSILP